MPMSIDSRRDGLYPCSDSFHPHNITNYGVITYIDYPCSITNYGTISRLHHTRTDPRCDGPCSFSNYGVITRIDYPCSITNYGTITRLNHTWTDPRRDNSCSCSHSHARSITNYGVITLTGHPCCFTNHGVIIHRSPLILKLALVAIIFGTLLLISWNTWFTPVVYVVCCT